MRRLGLAILSVLLLPAVAHAWTPAAHTRIADKGAQLAPPDLRLLLERYSVEYRRGVLDDHRPETELRHSFIVESRRGALRDQLQREIGDTIIHMRTGGPISDFVERLGRIAHLVSDVNNPFHVATDPARLMNSRSDFEAFLERRLERIPTVFYGLQWPLDIRRYLDASLIRSAAWYPLLDEEYFRGGNRRSATEFDDRSTGFGIAALAYSHSVTDLVHVYYHIWQQVGGDVRSAGAMRRSNLLRNE